MNDRFVQSRDAPISAARATYQCIAVALSWLWMLLK